VIKQRVSPLDLFTTAIRLMLENRLRSFLTFLGLTIGVTSLITVMTIIQGANDYVADQIANLGSNVFQVTKLANISEGIDAFIRSFRRKDITWDNYLYLKDNLRHAQRIGAQASASSSARFGNLEVEDTRVEGATANMMDIGSRELEDGRFFTEQEFHFARPVCVIGWDLRDKLFPGRDPVGRTVRIGASAYRILGYCKKMGGIPGFSQDNFVVIPLTDYFKRFGTRQSLDFYIQAQSAADFEPAMDEVRIYLRAVRKRTYHQPDDFTLVTSDTTISLFHSITDNFFLVFLMLSAVAAVVGGIVIMNIMLVAVTDRVMEIGVRRAVGARQRDILLQFLMETLLICLLGGAAGVGAGFLSAALFSNLAGIPAGIRPWVAVFGVSLSSLIGLFFGIYPAWKAARLDPVEALRAEK
jgi:putative ABC transport system permease protein